MREGTFTQIKVLHSHFEDISWTRKHIKLYYVVKELGFITDERPRGSCSSPQRLDDFLQFRVVL